MHKARAAYIHCLVIRNHVLYRLHIGREGLVDDTFVCVNHSTAFFPVDIGRLCSIHRTYSDNTYYKYWVFSARPPHSGTDIPLIAPQGATPIDDRAYYIDYSVSKPRRLLVDLITKGHTIVIAQYSCRDETSPIDITPDSPIVEALTQYHSRGVETWRYGYAPARTGSAHPSAI